MSKKVYKRLTNADLVNLLKERDIELERFERERLIETALERVRTRTMSMRKSDELGEVAVIFYKELQSLGVTPFFNCGYVEVDEKNKVQQAWMTSPEGTYMGGMKLPLTGDPIFKERFKNWEKNIPVFYQKVGGIKLDKHLKFAMSDSGSDEADEMIRTRFPKTVFFYCGNFSHGYLHIVTESKLSDEEELLLARFTAVFEMAYRRFLDLKTAEAQAREARIEAALEKVRTRTMAMQKTDELLDAAGLLYRELFNLGIPSLTSGYVLMDKDGKIGWNYDSSPEDGSVMSEPLGIPHTETKVMRSITSSWKKQEPYHIIELGPQETIDHQTFIAERTPNFPYTAAELLSFSPERLVLHTFNFKEGYLLMINGEKLSADEIELMIRFTRIFEMTYKRFLELKKAEAQARESEIQLALERVRARTMAMHHSDELKDIVAIVFEKLQELQFGLDGAVILGIPVSGTKETDYWLADVDKAYPSFFRLPYYDAPSIKDIWEAKKSGAEFIAKVYTYEEKNQWFQYAFEHTDLKILPNERKNWILEQIFLTQAFAISKNFILGIHYHFEKELSGYEIDIIKRFSKVFEQSYTRFLDLQKAEAQAREARIEAALERVRASSMAMHQSEDLGKVAVTMFNQLENLDCRTIRCGILVFHENKTMDAWGAMSDKQGSQKVFDIIGSIHVKGHPMINGTYESWQKHHEYFHYHLKGEDLRYYYEVLSRSSFKVPSLDQLPSEHYNNVFYFQEGALYGFTASEMSNEAKNIFKRFAHVFGQSYRRYLDLKKAEEQAREAQIEASLEKVRARAMAMHKSEELSEAAVVLYEELQKLGLKKYFNCGYVEVDEENKEQYGWTSTFDGKIAEGYLLPLSGDPVFDERYKSWKKMVPVFYQVVGGEQLKNHLKFAIPHLGSEQVTKMVKDQFPDPTIFYCCNFSHGYLHFITDELLSSEEEALLSRFTRVFEMAYKRFLDLKKAEEQAREAQIETALERIRARALAMHSSEELEEVVNVLREQMGKLGQSGLQTCAIHIYPENSETFESWYAFSRPGKVKGRIFTGTTYFRKDACSLTKKWIRKYKTGEKNYLIKAKGAELKAWLDIRNKHVPEIKKFMKEYPPLQFYQFADFSGGSLAMVSFKEPSDESKDLLRRAASVFDLAYKRFLDLKKAEAQARESEIQLALERVRARTMAMQSSQELSEAASVLFKQLRKLGGVLWSSGFVILDDNNEEGAFWMTNPEGEIIPPIYIPNTIDPATKNMYAHWKKGSEYYYEEAGGKELKAHYKYLMSLPKSGHVFRAIQDSGFSLPTWQQWHAAYFSHGYLLIITMEPFSERDLFVRFAKVFEQTYTRFLDLKKAEEQAREAQIEAALERVRASSMAMHKSDDLNNVLSTMFSELTSLEFELARCVIWIYNTEDRSVRWYAANPEAEIESYLIPYYDYKVINDYWKAWEERIPRMYYDLSGDLKKGMDEYVFNHTEMARMPKEVRDGMVSPEQVHIYNTFNDFGALFVPTIEPQDDEIYSILERFGKVFNQSYTRFKDIVKAEEQAREAQIEAALERVRARALAMHSSEELYEVAQVLREQMGILGQPELEAAVIHLYHENSETFESWYAMRPPNRKTGKIITGVAHFPINGSAVARETVKAYYKEPKEYTIRYSGRKLKEWMDQLADQAPGIVKYFKGELPKQHIYHFSDFYGGSLLMVSQKNPSQEAKELQRRAASVFDLAYRRFLDLKQAEAQSREAQIEAALERIRSKSMAMHKSDELQEVILMVFREMRLLNVSMEVSMVNIHPEDSNELHTWIANEEQTYAQLVHIPIFEHPINAAYLEALNRGEELFTSVFSKKVKDSYFDYIFKHSDLKNIPESRKKHIKDGPGYSISTAYKKHAQLMILKYNKESFTKEENEILIRFAQVFDQTYTRFLDLKKAEAQAREAQIEAALERVRSKAMAMQKSEDLSDSVAITLNELEDLDLTFQRCGIGIMDEKGQEAQLYTTARMESGEKTIVVGDLDLTVHPMLIEANKAWIKKEKMYSYVLKGKDLKDYYEFISKSNYPLPEESFKAAHSLKRQYAYFLMFPAGTLFFFSVKELSVEDIQVLQRFTDVFHLAYTRYEDLQSAEARALEAIRQASLDRVRGEIASMRSKEDLRRITPLIWKELNALGVPFIRCGVFIMEVENESIQCFLSTPDGKTLGVFNLPYYSELIGELMVDYWQKGKIYKDHWTKKQFKDFMNRLKNTGQISDTDSYQGSDTPPEKLDLHFIPFRQGMLYVGNISPLTMNELQLVKSLAESFSIAYARYEDFRELEKAKDQIEKTLNELKSTQSQLIHAEKMASLGELTAGIAHEIQNPLNFVNNFSEVSADLIAELKEIRSGKNGGKEDPLEKELLNDITQNLEKISFHGSRASSIVKGMLQHSRASSSQKLPTDINALVDEYLRLAYHGMRAKDKSFNVDFKADLDPELPKVDVVPQDIGRVLLNLINNAFQALSDNANVVTDSNYKPRVIVSTKKISGTLSDGESQIEICVSDNGPGIPESIKDKIFQPFFTTKPSGQGTGLGLSLSYDIIKAHGGELNAETKEGIGSKLIATLPVMQKQ